MVQEENEIARFAVTNKAYADVFYEQGRINSMSSWMPSLAAICSLTILGYGGSQVLNGTLAVGDFVAFFMFVNMVVQPFRVPGLSSICSSGPVSPAAACLKCSTARPKSPTACGGSRTCRQYRHSPLNVLPRHRHQGH